MPIRFRRSFKIFPVVKVNVSKGGVSVSVGKPGATLNFSKHGVRQTIGLPGSGVSQTSYLFKKDSKSEKEDQDADKDRDSKRAADEEEEERRWGASRVAISLPPSCSRLRFKSLPIISIGYRKPS